MELKTFRAKTMAEALAAVRGTFGEDAVILHTRHTRTRGILGLGARRIVEVMASSASSAHRARQRTARRLVAATPTTPAVAQPKPTDPPQRAATTLERAATERRRVVARADTADRPPRVARGDRGDPPASGASSGPAPGAVVMRVRRTGPRDGAQESQPEPGSRIEPGPRSSAAEARRAVAAENVSAAGVESELAAIRGLLAQTLECSRRSLVSAGGGGAVPGRMTDALTRQYLAMLEREVAADIADEIVGQVRDELTPAELADPQIVRETVLRRIAALTPAAEDAPGARPADGRPRTVALIGPTGVGKTTTVAKLAASYRLRHGKRVGLITTDTYRIAAVDQLRTYANIIGVPVRVALTPREMAGAVEHFAQTGADVVLIDTAGRSQRDVERLGELREFLEVARPHETHLVLSCAASCSTMVEAARKFGALAPNRVIFTKVDEAVNLGVLLSVVQRVDLKLSYLTTGQEVPDHIEPSRPERIARLVLDGVVGGACAAGAAAPAEALA